MSLQVYKASAGSGKTYQLALEYICLALQTAQPTAFMHTLAVTFTNKATGEMKDRILAYLYDLAHEGREHDFKEKVCKRLHISDEEATRRADATLHAIIHDYDHFRVETIDSFLQSLLTNLAYELKLTRGFSVDLDVDDIVSRAVDRLLLSVGQNDKARQQVKLTVQRFMEQKLDDNKGWSIAKDLKDFAKHNLFNDTYLRNEEALNIFLKDADNLRKYVHALGKVAQEKREELRQDAQAVYNFISELSNIQELHKTSVGTARTFSKNILEDNGKAEIKPTLLKAIDEPSNFVNAKYRNDTNALHIATTLAELAGKLVTTWTNNAFTINTIELTLEKLLPLQLLNEVGSEVSAINNETNTFMLAKTPDLFKKMVKNEDSSFIFERAGTTFQHVMIDEFQDTSLLQWEVFKRLLLENLAQGEDNMIVGDIKQSIYRWRGGDWKILHRVGEDMDTLGEVQEHQLDTNYRSREIVVKFNNAFFAHAAKHLDKLNEADQLDHQALISTIYRDVEQKVKPRESESGYVRLAFYDKDDDNADILNDLHDQIKLLHNRGISYADMAILVRKNDEGKQIIDFFTEHFPDETAHFTSDEAVMLSASPAVMLLIGALKFLNSQQADTVALELCHKMAQKLEYACGTHIPHDLSPLMAQREALLAMPLFELCERLIRFFHLPEAEAHGAGQSAYIFNFLDHVLHFLEDNASKLPDFIEYWETTLTKKAIAADAINAVRIMTVHKSKGLQRNTIFIPFCHWRLDEDRNGDIMWCNTQALPSPINALPLAPINQISGKKVKNSSYAAPYLEEHLNQRIDNFNTLYVALTRAEENLLIWSKEPSKLTNNSVGALLKQYVHEEMRPSDEENVFCMGELQPASEQQALANTHKIEKRKAIKDLTELAIDVHEYNAPLTLTEHAPSEVFRQSNEAAQFVSDLKADAPDEMANSAHFNYINRGNLLHYIFSLIHTTADVPYALAQAKLRGLFANQEEEKELNLLVNKRLSDPQAAEWFNGTWRIFAESTILRHDEHGCLEQCRPDRVMMRKDETVVIDYKTGDYQKSYDKQVRGYITALQQMGHTNVRGYLWMLTSGEVHQVG